MPFPFCICEGRENETGTGSERVNGFHLDVMMKFEWWNILYRPNIFPDF